MSKSSWFRLRLLIAGVFGIALTSIVFGVMSQTADSAFTDQQRHSRYSLTTAQRSVDDYRKQHGVFPPNLSTVWPSRPARTPKDDWNRPLLYSIRNNQAVIESLGRDGMRGGIGLDADLSPFKPHDHDRSMPTLPLGQRLAQPTGQLFGAAALICGIIVSIMVFASLENKLSPQISWPMFVGRLLINLLMMSLMAAFGAMIIAIFHIPSGH